MNKLPDNIITRHNVTAELWGFILDRLTDQGEMIKRLEELHRPITVTTTDGEILKQTCVHCTHSNNYPCATLQVVRGQL